MTMEVWMVSSRSFCFWAPKYWAARTLAPTDRPMNTLTSKLTSAEVAPTAARDSLPAKRPTTTTSAALNRSCSILDNASGTANTISLTKIGPLHISIS
jgi:hypothetical protein